MDAQIAVVVFLIFLCHHRSSVEADSLVFMQAFVQLKVVLSVEKLVFAVFVERK